MNIDRFYIYLVATLILLHIFGLIILFTLWVQYGFTGILVGCVITVLMDFGAIKLLQKTKLSDGNETDTNIFKSTITVGIILIISNIIITIIGIILGFNIAREHNISKIIGVLIPFIGAGMLQIALQFCRV
jgi:hypothetical protein